MSPFANASGDKPHPPSHYVRHPPPPQQGRWAFIRPARRIIVILFTLGRWGLVTSYSQLVTRDEPPFAKASGDEPPRHADARHPSAEGNLLRSRCGLSSPPLEGWHEVPGWLESAGLGTYSLVIPAPGVPANTNVFVGWIRRE